MKILIILIICAMCFAQPPVPHIIKGSIEPCADISYINAILLNIETHEVLEYPPNVIDVFSFDEEFKFRIQPSVIHLEMGDSFILVINDTFANAGAIVYDIVQITPPVYQNLGILWMDSIDTEGIPLSIKEIHVFDTEHYDYGTIETLYFDIQGNRMSNINNVPSGVYLKISTVDIKGEKSIQKQKILVVR